MDSGIETNDSTSEADKLSKVRFSDVNSAFLRFS